MSDQPEGGPDDEGAVQIIGHLLIRDLDSGEVLLSRRDGVTPPKPVEDED